MVSNYENVTFQTSGFCPPRTAVLIWALRQIGAALETAWCNRRGDEDWNACLPVLSLKRSLTNTTPELNKAKGPEGRDSRYEQVLFLPRQILKFSGKGDEADAQLQHH